MSFSRQQLAPRRANGLLRRRIQLELQLAFSRELFSLIQDAVFDSSAPAPAAGTLARELYDCHMAEPGYLAEVGRRYGSLR